MGKPSPILSKFRLLAYRQCPKRLWLTVNAPQLLEDSSTTQASYAAGHRLGEIAQDIFNPNGRSHIFDVMGDGVPAVLAETQKMIAITGCNLRKRITMFEAGFEAAGVRAFVDVLQPVRGPADLPPRWGIVEVKSGSEVKNVYFEDAAIQYYAAIEAGLELDCIAIAHVDTSWTYKGDEQYGGLLKLVDATHEIQGLVQAVPSWVAGAQAVLRKRAAPTRKIGAHCTDPYPCGFLAHCQSSEPVVEHPVQWLPRVSTKALREHLQKPQVRSMQDVPDDLLNKSQVRVKHVTLTGSAYVGKKGLAKALLVHGRPCFFLDFETTSGVVPRWAGTRAYQAVPFQFSLHRAGPRGGVRHIDFLDTSGNDPRLPLAKALVAACGTSGVVFAYNSGFESRCLRLLADYALGEARKPRLARSLLAIRERLVDLHPVMRKYYYHPSQQGSWSLKAIVPALLPALSYDSLNGVQNGGDAQSAYLEAIDYGTTAVRKKELRKQLIRYCTRDTLALVEIWRKFSA